MARVIFENLTKKQAETLVDWYQMQGEQQADTWFDINGVPTPWVDVSEQRKQRNLFEYSGDDIIIYTKIIE